MIIVNVFASDGGDDDAYIDAEQRANEYLKENPQAKIIASHTNMSSREDWTEFALTLIVELPDVAPPTQSEEHGWPEIYAMLKAHPAIHMQDNPDHTPSWIVTCPDANFSGTARSLEWLFDLVKEACDILDLPSDSF